MVKIIYFFLLSTISIVYSQTQVSGIIDSTLVLDLSESPYIVTDNLSIVNGGELIVDNNVELEINSYPININQGGVFSADGSRLVTSVSGSHVGIIVNSTGRIDLNNCEIVR